VALQSFRTLAASHIRGFFSYIRHMVGLPGRVISPSQGLYLHRTTQHRKTRDKHPCLERDSNHDPSNQPAKIHASDRTATVTGSIRGSQLEFFHLIDIPCSSAYVIILSNNPNEESKRIDSARLGTEHFIQNCRLDN
jgi:hypothetical protein